MKRLLSIVGLLGVALLPVGEAFANIVYGLSGVTFSDGGTLTGSFTTNDARTALLGYDITSSTGIDLGLHYTTANTGSSSTSLPFILVLSTPSLDNILQVTFDNLTPTGSTIKIGTFDSFEQHLTARRDITAGSVVAIPEPSTAALLAIGALGVMGYVVGRRRS